MPQLKPKTALTPARPPRKARATARIDPEALATAIEEAFRACRTAVTLGDKAALRRFHVDAKQWDKEVCYADLRKDLQRFRSFFPSAVRIDPERIDPVLVPVRSGSLESRLFRIVRGYWSMPYSKGYGRRLRFLVMDQFHGGIMGIIGLQSPSADLRCRDHLLAVPQKRKLQVVNNTLDAFTVGATPAYAPLLAGKLVAGFLHSPLIRQEYWRTYGKRRTTQLHRRIPQPLLAITTSSAMGRSSIYNRLRFGDRLLAQPLGYTSGYGTLHLESLYPKIATWLKQTGRYISAGYGNGPRVRWQNITTALVELGLSYDHLEHGICREVFLFQLVNNLLDVCRYDAVPDVAPFDDAQWAGYWKERWCLPRASRDPGWFEFDSFARLTDALSVAQEFR